MQQTNQVFSKQGRTVYAIFEKTKHQLIKRKHALGSIPGRLGVNTYLTLLGRYKEKKRNLE